MVMIYASPIKYPIKTYKLHINTYHTSISLQIDFIESQQKLLTQSAWSLAPPTAARGRVAATATATAWAES